MTETDLPTAWLLARASGILAYAALTLAVVAGLTLRTRLLGRAVSPAVVTQVHRTLSFVGIGSMLLHAGLIAVDSEVDVPLISLFVPGLAGYRTLATSLGVVAMELWLLIHLSFRMRSRIGAKRWRQLHYLTFPTWALAAAHGVLAGTDSAEGWMQSVYLASIAAVVGLVVVRAGSHRAKPPARRPPARPAAVHTNQPEGSTP